MSWVARKVGRALSCRSFDRHRHVLHLQYQAIPNLVGYPSIIPNISWQDRSCFFSHHVPKFVYIYIYYIRNCSLSILKYPLSLTVVFFPVFVQFCSWFVFPVFSGSSSLELRGLGLPLLTLKGKVTKVGCGDMVEPLNMLGCRAQEPCLGLVHLDSRSRFIQIHPDPLSWQAWNRTWKSLPLCWLSPRRA